MAEFLDDPSVLTKDKLKSALLANNVALPNGDQRKGVYVDLYLKNLTSQNKKSASVETFSSDEELAATTTTTTTTTSSSTSKNRSARKVTRKTDGHGLEEIDVTELSNEGLKDLLLKYGVNPGPIVASTRKLYEKKLQRLLDQGSPETVVLVTETVETRSADSDQYSDKEEDTAVVPELELEPEPEPEPVPVVEWPIRSRGKTPVTTRTRSTQHMDFSKLSASEMLAPSKEKKLLAIPKEPKPLLADEVPASFSVTESSSSKSPKYPIATVRPALDEMPEAISVDKIYEKIHLSMKSRSSQRTPSSFQHVKKISGSSTAAHFPVAPNEEPQSFLKSTALLEESKSKTSSKLMKQSVQPCSTSPQLSKDLIHTMCRLSPSPFSQGKESPNSTFLVDSPYHPMQDLPVTKSLSEECSGSTAALSWGKQTKIQRFLSPITHVRGQDDAFIEERRNGLVKPWAVGGTVTKGVW
ncbi:thymopoietin a isoform X1 [Trichomycterus rosablanca]|uniref:thymopoietin a isoform X1 n=1 Tax=Trichomycterus rosablanca TaxID=2290929 RepID=UPI002F352BAE